MVSIHPPVILGDASPMRPWVAVVAALAVLLGDAGLEAAGWGVPRPLPWLGPLGGASALLTILLVGWYLFRRYTHAPRHTVDEMLPLAMAVFGMGAVLECAGPIVRWWTLPPAVSAEIAAPLYRLGMGGSLLVALVALSLLVPRYRTRLREFASVGRLRSGLLFTLAVLAVVYAVLLWVGFVLVGPGEMRLRVPIYLPATLTLIASQAAIALGEEFFYRGLLQREVGRIFRRARVLGQGRDRRLVAIAAVSMLFAFQHLNPAMPRPLWIKVFLFSFVMSFLLLLVLLSSIAARNDLKVQYQKPWHTARVEQAEADGTPVSRKSRVDFGSTEHFARFLYTDYAVPFELITVLVMAAVAGVIVLARRPERASLERTPLARGAA